MLVLDSASSSLFALAESATFSRTDFGTSQVELNIPTDRLSECPLSLGQQIKVTHHGQTLLIGTLTEANHQLTGSSESWHLVISDYWWHLENILYISQDNRSRDSILAMLKRSNASVEDVQATVKLSEALSTILDHAISVAHLPFTYRLAVSDDSLIIPFAIASNSYASLLTEVQKWVPDLSAWFEYGQDDSITLVLAQQAQIPALTLPLSSIEASSLSLKARPDLVPPAVGIVVAATLNGSVVRQSAVYPPGASLSVPYAMTAEIDAPDGLTVTNTAGPDFDTQAQSRYSYTPPPYVTILGEKFPTSTTAWEATLKRWMPTLSDCENVEVATALPTITGITPLDTNHRAYDATAITHELISGQINGTCKKIKWGRVHVSALVRVTNPPASIAPYFPDFAGYVDGSKKRFTGRLLFEVTTTNVHHMRYLLDEHGTVEYDADNPEYSPEQDLPAPESYNLIPLYSGLLKSIYDATRIMPYEGEITIHTPLENYSSGAQISISEARPEWLNMRSVVRQCTLDLASGSCSLTIGPANHLSLQDAIDKSIRLAKSLERSAMAKTPTHSGDGSLGGSLPEGLSQPYQTGSTPDEKKPEFPSISPSVTLLSAQEPSPLGSKSNFFDFQVRRSLNASGSTEKFHVHRGKIIINGKYLSSPATLHPDSINDTEPDWVAMPANFTTGEIWLKTTFDHTGAWTGSTLTTTGGVSTPIPLSINPSFDASTTFTYFTHIATVTASEIWQHQVGSIYLPLATGTFGPPGMA